MPDDAMAQAPPPLQGIVHDQVARRFVVVVDGVEAELDYLLGEHAITITHTGVPPAIGGRGVAGALVHAAVEFARGAGLRWCQRVRTRRHGCAVIGNTRTCAPSVSNRAEASRVECAAASRCFPPAHAPQQAHQ